MRKLFTVFLLTLIAPLSWGAVVYSNFGVGDTYSGGAWIIGLPGDEFRRAARFTPTFNGTFDSLRVAVGHVSGTNSYEVSLAADNAGLPGATIETFSGVVFPSAPGIITLTSAANPPLLAGGNYWVVMRAPDPVAGTGSWFVNNQGLQGSHFYRLSTLAWAFQSGGNTPAYEVNATAAPGSGICGAANGVATLSAPTANLCSVGNSGVVTANPASFDWTCVGTGSSGNNSAMCAAPRQYTVTANPGVGGALSCASPVTSGFSSNCTATPNAGYVTQNISGCGGVASGVGVNSYSTAAVTADCTVTATFAPAAPVANAAAVPALPVWALLTMMSLLATFGIGRTRRHPR